MKIELMGREVLVVVTDKANIKKIAGDRDVVGFFDDILNVIFLDESLSFSEKKTVLTHELAHATLAYSGLKNVISDRKQEAICDAFEGWVKLLNIDMGQLQLG